MITAIIIAAVLAFLAALALLTARVVSMTVGKPDPRDTSFAISAGAGAASVIIAQRALKIAAPAHKGPAE